MTIRRRMREQQSLGAAIDARQRSARELEQQQGLGGSGAAPLSSGGSTAGGGGVTLDPALPESFVTGLAGGTGNPYQAGELTITGSGSASVTQDALAGEIDVHAPAYTAGDGLDLTAEEFAVDSTVLRTSGDQAVSGLKTFSTLPRSAATPLDDTDLTTKDYVDERTKVVHRQVFPAAGSRDSLSGNSEINLPWATKEFPSGTSPSSVSIDTLGDQTFSTTIGPCIHTANALRFQWTSSEFSGAIISGLQLSLAVPVPLLGTSVQASARLLIENVDRIASVVISLNNINGTAVVSGSNLVGEVTSDVWTEVVSSDLNVTSLGNIGFLSLTIQGTDVPSNVGATNVQVDWMSIVQLE